MPRLPAAAPDAGSRAVETIAERIYGKYDTLKDKKITVYSFSSLSGEEVPEGKQIADRLTESLINRGDLTIVEREQLDRILGSQSVEMTGMVDPDLAAKPGKMLPVDVAIYGTIVQKDEGGEISVKVVDIHTGRIYLATTVSYAPEKGFSYQENQKMADLYRENPARVDTINRTVRTLRYLSVNRPFVFLMVTVTRQDVPYIRSVNPDLGQKIQRVRYTMQRKDPAKLKKLAELRRNVEELKEYDPGAYQAIEKRKKELIRQYP
jgi:TolB-like protein